MLNRHPLVVDLDGTLTVTDTLAESLVHLVRNQPLSLFAIPFWLLGGRDVLKARIGERVVIQGAGLPYREDLLAYLNQEHQSGRRIVLATAAHESIANNVASHLGLFSDVLASREGSNLKGREKLAAIKQHVGADFVYAGDSHADLPIWAEARGAILVDTSRTVSERARSMTTIEREFAGKRRSAGTWLRALRIHQWIKNLLMFVPLLTAFSFSDPGQLATSLLAFMAFSLVASATYIANDLWDLQSDRIHPRKRNRPFASGQLSIFHGVALALCLLAVGGVLASLISLPFFAMLALYTIMTTAYSFVLKGYVLIDVLMLALLYTLRIIAGAVALSIAVSSWLLAFSVFVFFSLAMVKRCSELVSLKQGGKASAHGRDYRVEDLTVLWPLGAAASMSSVVVFGLFILAPDTQARYLHPELLWLTALGLSYWLSRLWIKTSRSEMHDDPVVYAIIDRGSRITVGGIVATMLLARFLPVAIGI